MNRAQSTIVFLHIPKAAGTAIKAAIIEKFGQDSIQFDYARPLARGRLPRNIKCIVDGFLLSPPQSSLIFGHFLVGKYADLSKGIFRKKRDFAYAVFFRDPLQRAISHYYFWKVTNVKGHAVWEKFTRENWGLERFLLSKEHDNFHSQFLWRFPISNFDFVGVTEHFDESVRMLGCAFPVLSGLSIRSDNSNPEKEIGQRYAVDPALAAEFKLRNKVDYALYEQALRIFEQQRQRFSHGACSE
jgi:hypothetical protein